jgi:putative DNA primase/helicase
MAFCDMDSRFLDLRTLQAALGGDISCGQVLCPGPNHSRRDRSLAVKQTASGVLVYSHAGDDWRDCRDYVHARLGLPTWQPGNHRHHINVSDKWTDPEPERWRTDRAKAIWDEGREPRGTAAEEYLTARSLHLPSELCGSVLRFHPQCLWRSELIPCLIAAFTSIVDNTITAIHRIRLDRPERWPKTERKMFGAVAGSAIKLDCPGDRLAVAEGLESAMAARQLGFSPVWALGSARRFLPIDGVRELIILGERDDASRRATDVCSGSWIARGMTVHLALPAIGKDFNDYVMGAR